MSFIVEGLQWIADPANWSGPNGIPTRLFEHVMLSLIGLLIAALIAIPVGLLVGHTRRFQFAASQVSNLGRAIPSFAALSLAFLVVVRLWPDRAFGFLPTLAALVLLGIPVILVNTYVGVSQVDPDAIEAARGMGMNGNQLLLGLEVPLAMPLIMTGVRLAALQIVATATIAALIAGPGLGRYIVDGDAQQNDPMLVGGAILVALLAVGTEAAFGALVRATSPRLRSRGSKRIMKRHAAGPSSAKT